MLLLTVRVCLFEENAGTCCFLFMCHSIHYHIWCLSGPSMPIFRRSNIPNSAWNTPCPVSLHTPNSINFHWGIQATDWGRKTWPAKAWSRNWSPYPFRMSACNKWLVTEIQPTCNVDIYTYMQTYICIYWVCNLITDISQIPKASQVHELFQVSRIGKLFSFRHWPASKCIYRTTTSTCDTFQSQGVPKFPLFQLYTKALWDNSSALAIWDRYGFPIW